MPDDAPLTAEGGSSDLTDEQMLKRLAALNLERAAAEPHLERAAAEPP